MTLGLQMDCTGLFSHACMDAAPSCQCASRLALWKDLLNSSLVLISILIAQSVYLLSL